MKNTPQERMDKAAHKARVCRERNHVPSCFTCPDLKNCLTQKEYEHALAIKRQTKGAR